MPDLSNMCINVMTTQWSRVRHWSAPERLQWSPTEKADSDPINPTSTSPDLSTASQFGCKSMNDLNFLKPSFAPDKPLQVFHDDIEYFADFYSLDGDPCGASVDPFDDEPIVHESEPMTVDEMGRNLLKFWSPVAAADKDNPLPESGGRIEDADRPLLETKITTMRYNDECVATDKQCLSDTTTTTTECYDELLKAVETKQETLIVKPETSKHDFERQLRLRQRQRNLPSDDDALPRRPGEDGQAKLSNW